MLLPPHFTYCAGAVLSLGPFLDASQSLPMQAWGFISLLFSPQLPLVVLGVGLKLRASYVLGKPLSDNPSP